MPDSTPVVVDTARLLGEAMTAYLLANGTRTAPADRAPAFMADWLEKRGLELRPKIAPDEVRAGDEIEYLTGAGPWPGRVLTVDYDLRVPLGDPRHEFGAMALVVDFGHAVIRLSYPDELARVRRTGTVVPVPAHPITAPAQPVLQESRRA